MYTKMKTRKWIHIVQGYMHRWSNYKRKQGQGHPHSQESVWGQGVASGQEGPPGTLQGPVPYFVTWLVASQMFTFQTRHSFRALFSTRDVLFTHTRTHTHRVQKDSVVHFLVKSKPNTFLSFALSLAVSSSVKGRQGGAKIWFLGASKPPGEPEKVMIFPQNDAHTHQSLCTISERSTTQTFYPNPLKPELRTLGLDEETSCSLVLLS